MPPHRKISEVVRQQVRQRASSLCEYCHASEQWQYVQFTVDHVIPIAQGGVDTIENLALACFHCNRRKADKITAIDPQFDAQVLLFNPRQDIWKEHFIWSGDVLSIVGITPTGRATVVALGLNREWVINIRAADRAIGRHPPIGDPIQQAE
ncbi:HNH endonuclease [Trichocoleus sp. DQ-A3]|uniref:HNH endonuclease n=1 Tax=Cyanophyceae TaxID=3028117 RepID=UPI0016896EF0|nr:HNH endonuclease signature motif containing protein [Coleofasciculus sp. FACHB-125]MBD1903061.1 HNH endonuclease [Coleofasciculus sp. FACHB-125]